MPKAIKTNTRRVGKQVRAMELVLKDSETVEMRKKTEKSAPKKRGKKIKKEGI